MKVACIGGGPAGLYFAILLKKIHPAADITVFERNPEGVTFGWGVVFSDETLSYLEESDRQSYEAITASFAHWDAIDIHFKGRVMRSGGHGFSGVSRRELLRLLEARAHALGVKIEFGVEVEDYREHTKGCDLVIACDGLRSKVRELHKDTFRPSIDPRKAHYMWLGTKKKFDAFTFLFEENDHGMFQVHAYRFDDEHSTFIAECDGASFEAAGLAKKSTEESIAYLQKLFGKYLDGHALLANHSSWVQFGTVKNECWHHGNVVLMGDAVHTAHFSIGSGTKLAMEDAIALVAELEKELAPSAKGTLAERITRSLASYEEARRPIVERIQKAAQDSLTWFENVRRYKHLTPEQFSFSLLTRSKRITYENLKLRDPRFIDQMARHFEDQLCKGAPKRADAAPRPPMFQPFKLRDLVLENRVMVSPMCMYSAHDGVPDEFHLVHYGSRAMGGVGLLMAEMTNVSAEGRITPHCTGLYNEAQRDAWKRIVDFVHARSGAKFGMQLGHAGRKGSTKVMWEGSDEPLASGNWPIMSASPLPFFPHSQVPKEMTRADMDRVKAEYVKSTTFADEAGFDLLEVHMAHGYLLASFLSPLTNVRTDAYGGAREARMKFPLEVFEAVRQVWPKHKPMSVRISSTDWVDGGVGDEDVIALAKALKERGADILDCSAGMTTPASRPRFYGRMYQAYFSDMVRHEVGIPTICVGNVSSSDQINTLVASGRADLCALARPHLENPHFTFAAAKEQGFEALTWPKPYGIVRPQPLQPT